MKLIRELTHEGVSDVHAKSILIGILDPMTRQHTAYKQSDRFETFKDAVLEFTNAAVSMSVAPQTGKGDPMQIGSLGAELGEWSTHDGQSGDEQSSLEKENLWTVAGSRTCFTCGGRGHRAKECPSQGKGKGQLMGQGTHKGGFKGRGFDTAGGWTCGGPHFANECPHNQGRTLSLAEWFPSEWQGNVQELAKSLRVIEPPEEKPTVASSKNKLPERQPSQDAPSPPGPQVARSNTPAQRRAAQEEAGSSCCCTHGGDNCSGGRGLLW